MSKSLKLIVEALLFAADKPLAVREIRSCIPDSSGADIRSALKALRYEYEAMGRSFALKEVATGFQFRSRNEYGSYILKMLQKSPSRLSRAAMETVAIIAYKQPVLRQEIERFRGVDVGGILKTLLEKELIKIVGRKNLPGRPLIYGTTKRFLEVFDLKNIESLPKLKEIKDFGTDEDEQAPPQQEAEQDTEIPAADPGSEPPPEDARGEAEDQQNPLPGGGDIETQGGRAD